MENIYLNELANILDNIEKIQEKLLANKKDIENIIALLKEFSSNPIDNNLDDPIIQRAKKTLQELINDLQNEYYKLESLTPTPDWQKFHSIFLNSLKQQIEGYKEIFLVFIDGNITHITVGTIKVKNALDILHENV
ncbi:MAG: hypothetical protein N2485_01995 [bacterium]|nr:hypothetical protein [bacterium]